MKIILGSKSPGRREALERHGYKFDVMVSGINEEAIRSDDYWLLPLLIARGKAKALLPKIKEDAILITSDQVVVCNGELREKPKDALEAKKWLKSYEHHHSIAITSVVVTNTANNKTAEGVDVVKVYFNKIPDKIIDMLIKKGRILQTAGACVGEDPLLNPYIKKLDGDMDSLTGLPMKLTQKLLKEVGFKT